MVRLDSDVWHKEKSVDLTVFSISVASQGCQTAHYRFKEVHRIPERYFVVLGEALKPGPYPYLGKTDLVKAIVSAGGFTKSADLRRIELKRWEGQNEILDIRPSLAGQAKAPSVYPGDTVVIQKRKKFLFGY